MREPTALPKKKKTHLRMNASERARGLTGGGFLFRFKMSKSGAWNRDLGELHYYGLN